ncbi:unnamed protein product [Nyctereutes procyonoides]|uniref:(raccoon dog) hypothetical protein n=1 Tax=Nyctereutes procyonoides TaxID=34880 RepID=A0A811Z055_NYCPR|nr:unnamed protein product [Nyctereutes procyonoides]
MTLFHFGNYLPYLITYECSNAAPGHLSPTRKGGIYDFIGDFVKATVDVIDLIDLNLVTSWNAGKGGYEIMAAALGCPPPSSLCPYIQMGNDSNISLVHYIVSSVQVWMIKCYDLCYSFQPVTFIPLCSLGSWTALSRAVVTGLLALSTLVLHVTAISIHSEVRSTGHSHTLALLPGFSEANSICEVKGKKSEIVFTTCKKFQYR